MRHSVLAATSARRATESLAETDSPQRDNTRSTMSETTPQVRSDVNVIKEGTVYKLAGYFRKTWEPRWFRLRGRQLLYYKSETDTMEPRQKLSREIASLA